MNKMRSGSVSGFEDDDSSDSSIGAPDDSDEDEEEEEDEGGGGEEEDGGGEEDGVVSWESGKQLLIGSGSLSSLASLEESLPIKHGLSLHMSGKSKSFTNLAEACIGTVKDLEKIEHPFNKKRRMLRLSRNNLSSGYYKFANPRSMPVLPLIMDEDDEEEAAEEGGGRGGDPTEQRSSDHLDPSSPGSIQRQRNRVMKSRSCFDLADLPEEEEDDDD
ncbi:hypothetical protein SAY87_026028 [Trapa incisa]|uniref:Uncharacterized protein n=1 Tax=Trapa incisa TaxID=236973 RepID=A0AAN7JCR3_9MYRT|nr:hypothetical protein SAY87_026028 [Trapa incisa]